MRAVVTDPERTPRLRLSEVPRPEPAPDQALIKVEAVSLNAGETRRALEATTAYVPGWDFAGVIEEPAADGTTPPKGARVYGAVPLEGAWAEYVAASATVLAEIPDGVTMAQAAALPIAGITALVALESAGTLLGRRVLVTGASGGVGRYACQLAHLAGAEVTAISRRPALPRLLREDGVPATVHPTITAARDAGRYDVILDGVGGDSLGTALGALAPGGVCVSFGNGSRTPASFDPVDFYNVPGARLQGLWLGNLLTTPTGCGPILTRLATLVANGRLHVPIDAVLPWTSINEAATRITTQAVHGKLTLEIP
ncbi:zinc-binding dehydrogenase [Actinomadura sp. NAK00032]|uniref:zinc-binding dehydrogenase n=1 Tax=Actinomadura sp. NAK00032 TaxID=2742128 RepID=UPI0015913D92|nr:zinc-binding dehydrogenase [Actinomadura sp. NAK00032]QKW38307.1 zinc-binding dehydrogenase [Actinomadura sp. NAK00032]